MATTFPWRLNEITLREVKKAKFQAAVLPFGATESHSLHLPYGTDNIQVDEIADRACRWAWEKGARVALLPTIPYGSDETLLDFPMTISLPQEHLDAIVAEVARSLEFHNVRKLVILNGHGGNDFKGGLRSLYNRTSVFCCLINWYQALADKRAEIFEKPGEHADEMETSLVQAIAPDLVAMNGADDGSTYPPCFEAARKGHVWFPRSFKKATQNSGFGDPRKAHPEKGRQYLKAAEERIGSFLVDLAQSKMDKNFPFKRGKR